MAVSHRLKTTAMTISKEDVIRLNGLSMKEVAAEIYGRKCKGGGEVCGIYRVQSGIKVLVATPGVSNAEMRTFRPLESVAQ